MCVNQDFSRYANMKTKCQSKLDATPDIRIQLSNIKPNFKRILMSQKADAFSALELDVLIDGVLF